MPPARTASHNVTRAFQLAASNSHPQVEYKEPFLASRANAILPSLEVEDKEKFDESTAKTERKGESTERSEQLPPPEVADNELHSVKSREHRAQ